MIFLKRKEYRKCLRSVGLILIAVRMLTVFALPIRATTEAVDSVPLTLDCPSAILMEASTGEVLFEQNPDAVCPPASITKIMTLLLVMEAIEQNTLRLDDMVTASAHASSMGGSQIYLKEGECMSVEDMIKSVVISSANDAALALAEHLCGSEETFVAKMNEKARELGMKNTHFENTNGLDDTVENHLTTARDVALMSRALIAHPLILKYSSIWMDTIRDGTFGLTNTNRLIRFYPGATGLKTGSTSKARFCISATAQRDGMSLICVIMGADTRDIRNEAAKKLLDWGFANYEMYVAPIRDVGTVPVRAGTEAECGVEYTPFSRVVPKGTASTVEEVYDLPEYIIAPIVKGQRIGGISYRVGDRMLGQVELVSQKDIERIGFGGLFMRLLRCFVGKY